jgi:hypothetical protein
MEAVLAPSKMEAALLFAASPEYQLQIPSTSNDSEQVAITIWNRSRTLNFCKSSMALLPMNHDDGWGYRNLPALLFPVLFMAALSTSVQKT